MIPCLSILSQSLTMGCRFEFIAYLRIDCLKSGATVVEGNGFRAILQNSRFKLLQTLLSLLSTGMERISVCTAKVSIQQNT